MAGPSSLAGACLAFTRVARLHLPHLPSPQMLREEKVRQGTGELVTWALGRVEWLSASGLEGPEDRRVPEQPEWQEVERRGCRGSCPHLLSWGLRYTLPQD